jgi:MarR family transcriptional regulator, organic hydroperoxide resistance regulator
MNALQGNEEQMMECLDDIIHRFYLKNQHPGLDICKKQEMTMLELLGKRGAMIMSELSDSARLCLSTATGIIDGLVSKGLVARSRSDEDRRIVQVQLTEEGITLYEQILETRLNMVRGMLGALDPGEQEIFVTLFRKIVAAGQA